MNREGLLSARYRLLDDFVAAAGGGMGFSNGVDTPRTRVIASFAYAPRPSKGPGDTDADGVTDDIDACPKVAGPKDPPEIEQIEVHGHTDAKGKLFFNMRLSEARAESVRQWLIKKAIAETKLVSKGYGPLKPIAPNYTAAGREENRRVGFKILKRKK